MTVLVAIPYYRCGPWIERCVRSCLAQTYEDIVVLVAGDGDDPRPYLQDVHDSRLVVEVFPTNWGAPHTQQAMLLASPFEWYAPMGADDWLEPEHIEACLAVRNRLVGLGAVYWHQGTADAPARVKKVDYETGTFMTELLVSVGGYGAHEKCGQDITLLKLLRTVYPMAYQMRPTYHRFKRPGSLTTDPATGHHSALRQGIWVRNDAMRRAVKRYGGQVALIKAYRESLYPPDVRAALDARVAQLVPALAAAAAA